MACNNFPY